MFSRRARCVLSCLHANDNSFLINTSLSESDMPLGSTCDQMTLGNIYFILFCSAENSTRTIFNLSLGKFHSFKDFRHAPILEQR